MNETMKPSCGEAYDATPIAVLAASETLTITIGMLTKSPLAAIAAGGLTGCVCALALPCISGCILGRKRDAILSWWDENLEVYKKFKAENPNREPSKRAEKREERDLAIWWLDAMRLVRTKELMREKVEALIETGSRMPDGVDLDDYETVEEYRARYVAPVSKMTATMLSLAVGLGTAATCYVGMTGNLHSPLLFLLGGITSILVTAVGAMCDQRSRVLPFGLSIATYPLAVLTAFGHGGVSGLIGNLLCGVGIYAIFAITNHLFRITGGADAVGAGDRRLVPAIATACGFHGTVYGMGAMCITMLANYIPRYRAKEITLKSRVPMGPFLLVWKYEFLRNLGRRRGLLSALQGDDIQQQRKSPRCLQRDNRQSLCFRLV